MRTWLWWNVRWPLRRLRRQCLPGFSLLLVCALAVALDPHSAGAVAFGLLGAGAGFAWMAGPRRQR